jgi:uncharacterized protein (DUF58 family)
VIATSRLYGVLALLAAVGLYAAFEPRFAQPWLGVLCVVILAAVIDAIALMRLEFSSATAEAEDRRDDAIAPDDDGDWKPALKLERRVAGSLALGVQAEVKLTLRNYAKRSMTVSIWDRPPASVEVEGLPFEVEIPAGRDVELQYWVRPNERGAQTFDSAHVRVLGPLGLLRRQVAIGDESVVRVLPNFKAVSKFALMALADKVGQLGVRILRRRGQGLEFSHLREYREGDLTRQIDWKATARRRKLISREYQDEKNQHVVALIDCGSRMRAKDGELSHFDHVLNASLLLSHVALSQGDSVAVGTFGGRDVWVPRQRGPRGMNVILEQIYDLKTTLEPPDFLVAARRLMARQKRRALVIVVTNLYDEVSEDLLTAVALLKRRHVVLVASLREDAIEALTEIPVERHSDALTVASAHEFNRGRRVIHESLSSQGVITVDVVPGELSVQLVNRYLEVKRSGLL